MCTHIPLDTSIFVVGTLSISFGEFQLLSRSLFFSLWDFIVAASQFLLFFFFVVNCDWFFFQFQFYACSRCNIFLSVCFRYESDNFILTPSNTLQRGVVSFYTYVNDWLWIFTICYRLSIILHFRPCDY